MLKAMPAPAAILVASTVVLILPHVHILARERVEFVLRGGIGRVGAVGVGTGLEKYKSLCREGEGRVGISRKIVWEGRRGEGDVEQSRKMSK